MTHILETIPNDAELEAMACPKNQNKQKMLEKKRSAKRRLESMLDDIQLKRAIGADADLDYF
ncbi:hypothetical protein [Shewanella gelidii]|uniref:Uncharacterized protein n=1 Tax=Shewanella gelidii TaxID=1642821 RepID=A0A917NCI9_9GAMM|nr:hypothetical protein [Shewanella gelidii]MCL1098810.1 hypothetical protein [Shewanella gelidii]GGI87519.1 hypothetical protein GCM10009332_25960 [Shewanella gelidii]